MDSSQFEGLLNTLNPKTARVHRDEAGDLHLEVLNPDGNCTRYERVTPARSFPLIAPDEFISFFDDEHGYLGMFRDLRQLDDEMQELLEEEMEKRYFVPRITSVKFLRINAGIIAWRVETDRGPRVFDVRDRDDIRIMPGSRLLIRDVDGNRYEIVNHTRLDRRSRDLLEQLL